MQQIQPIQQTNNSTLATQLSVASINDNLIDACSFDWKLFDSAGTLVNNGTIQCAGTDYSSWQGDNSYPYTFISTQLGLTLIIS